MPITVVRPRPLDDRPARWVTALWAAWVDPLEVAFADLAAQQELEALQQRRARRPAAGEPPAAGAGQPAR